MADLQLRRLLNRIAEQLRDTDLQNLKYLCHGKMGAGELERSGSAIEFLNLLIQRDLVTKDDYSFLEDILERGNRKDLASTVRTSGGTQMLKDSGSLRRHSMDSRYRSLLSELSDELTQRDLESLKFLVGLPAAVGEKTQTGHALFEFLQNKGDIGPSCMDKLEDMFVEIHRKDLANKLKKFVESRGVATAGVPPVNPATQPTAPSNGRQPISHSELQPTLPKKNPISPLLRPGDFMKISISTTAPRSTQPVAPEPHPSAPREPRYPVQVNEVVQPLDEEDEMPSYPMTKRPRGIALIFSNQSFPDNPELSERQGNQQDVENLKVTFENLHFEVFVKEERTASEMYTIAREFSLMNHTEYDCFVCCILSHGVLGSVYGTDSNLIEINDITSQFKGNACPTLADKPKLFFVQACRGNDFDRGAPQTDATRDADGDAIRQNAEPNESHFLLGYATPSGYVSWRSQVHGSWYVSKLCEVLTAYCERYDLMSMMVKVNDEVSEAYTRNGYKQCPAPVVTLRRRIYISGN